MNFRKMRYLIRKLKTDAEIERNPDPVADGFGIPSGLDAAYISSYVWDENHYCPESRAYVGWNEKGLHVWMLSLETVLRMEVKQYGGRVCDDSCLEFFLNPSPGKSDTYLNYECSPLPCVFFSTGSARENRNILPALPPGMLPHSIVLPQKGWSISYLIPADYLKKEFGVELRSGLRMKGNFYKCGDLTPYPHFGSWNPIDAHLFPQPDFHRPEFFEEMILE